MCLPMRKEATRASRTTQFLPVGPLSRGQCACPTMQAQGLRYRFFRFGPTRGRRCRFSRGLADTGSALQEVWVESSGARSCDHWRCHRGRIHLGIGQVWHEPHDLIGPSICHQ